MIDVEGLQGLDLGLTAGEGDTAAPMPLPPAAVFPSDWSALFSGSNPYEATAVAAVANDGIASVARVFAEPGAQSRYAVRGGYPLQGEVAIPRPVGQMPTAVGVAVFGVLQLLFLLFLLVRRQYFAQVRRYVNSRFFNVASVRTAETAVPLSVGFRVGSDAAWALLVGFMIWYSQWLQWRLRTSAEETLLGMLACIGGMLLLMGLRYAVLASAERLSGRKELSWELWENAQVPMRAMWPLLLVGALLSVYTVPTFQWYVLLVVLGMAGVGWVLRAYRLMMAFRWHGYGWLYFFLYLCGVEIVLPLLAVRFATLYLLGN